jgi:hypothetical protein
MLFLTREEVRFRTEDTINDHATNPSGSMRAENSITDSEHHSSIDQGFIRCIYPYDACSVQIMRGKLVSQSE